METPYPKKERDTYERISGCVSEYGADDVHNVVTQGPSEPAADPKPAPKSPEGLK